MTNVIYDTMFRNQELALKLNRPSCQDTGVLQFWVKCGTKFPLIDNLEALLKDAVMQATVATPLRHNSVETFSNLMLLFLRKYQRRHQPKVEDIVPNSDKCEIYTYMAGGGCTLPGNATVLMPGEGYEGVTKFVFDRMTTYGLNACPPLNSSSALLQILSNTFIHTCFSSSVSPLKTFCANCFCAFNPASTISAASSRRTIKRRKQVKKSNYKPQIPDLMEAVFDAVYLTFDLAAAVLFFIFSKGNILYVLYGILTLTLCGGDAFHLVPRIIRAVRGTNDKIKRQLGIGLQVSSITMTMFYILLMYIWKYTFPELKIPVVIEGVIWISAVIRIVICMFPQNNWCTDEGNMKLSVIRNAVFAVTGIGVMIHIYAQVFGIINNPTCGFVLLNSVTGR